jgi:hypothetical protein
MSSDTTWMNSTTLSAAVTACGAIIGTIVTVYFNVIYKQKQEDNKLSGVDVNINAAYVFQVRNIDKVPLIKDESIPFDSSILYAKEKGILAVRLPKINEPLFSILFMFGWLIGWTAGIYFAGYVVVSGLFSEQSPGGLGYFGLVFMIGWLVAAVAGEFAAINALYGSVVSKFSSRYLLIMQDTLFTVNKLGPLRMQKLYFMKFVRNFRADNQALVFEYGKNDIIVPGLTRVEADWLRGHVEHFHAQKEPEPPSKASAKGKQIRSRPP